jgi:hypothetical protein
MISKYKTNTQPLYVLTDLEGNSLNEEPTISYVSVEEYGTWLKSGISISKITPFRFINSQSILIVNKVYIPIIKGLLLINYTSYFVVLKHFKIGG